MKRPPRSSSYIFGRKAPWALLLVLLLATLAPLAMAARKRGTSRDNINIFFFLKNMIASGEYESNESKRTDLSVIGAGLGRTGTSSYMTALEELGLQSYHMKGVVGTPGHVELWIEYLTERQTSKNGRASKETANKLIEALALAGFDSTASMPSNFLFQDLMEHYPDAKVVMTVRGDGNGQAWAKSMLNSVANMGPAMRRPPFKHIGRLKLFNKMFLLMMDELGAPVNATTGLPNRDDLAKAYDDWVAHVKSVVPKERLLPFAAQSGWKPLCDFVSPSVGADVQEACREILESGDPYPRVNDSANVQRMLRFLHSISWTFEHPLQVLLMGALVIMAVSKVFRLASLLVVKVKKE